MVPRLPVPGRGQATVYTGASVIEVVSSWGIKFVQKKAITVQSISKIRYFKLKKEFTIEMGQIEVKCQTLTVGNFEAMFLEKNA